MKRRMKKFKKPRIKKNRFQQESNSQESIIGFFSRSILMMFKSWWIRKKIKDEDINCWFCKSEPRSCSIVPVVTWLGHSSFLIQIGGVNILTDPVLSEASYFFPRYLGPGISAEKLPNIDFVLISHNHPDHMDSGSLMKLKAHCGTSFLVPQGDKLWFDRRSFARVREYTWWQQDSFTLKNDTSSKITFTFLPSNHWSLRGAWVFDKNRSLWGSWLIEFNGHKIYFAGDTMYDSHFKEIAQEYPGIDVALMPIGPCEPRKWVAHSHLDADQAVKAFIDLQAKNFVPMHWGTFPMGTELFDTPILGLKKSWREHAHELNGKKLHMPKVGQSLGFGFQEIQDTQKFDDISDVITPAKKSVDILEK